MIEKTPIISIIVPVYNVEMYINACIESIVKQSFENFELLLVVGESTDNSTLICLNWAKLDSRIFVIIEEEKGVGKARNTGIKHSRGRYLAFVDSDDKIDGNMLEKLYNKAVETNADIVECDFYRVRAHKNELEYNAVTGIMGKEFDNSERLLLGNVTLWKMLIKKNIFTDNKIVQPNPPHEDMYIYPILLYSANTIACVSEPLYYYYKERPNNLSSYDYCNDIENNIVAFENMINELRRRKLFEYYEMELSAYCRRWISRVLSPTLGKIEDKIYFKYHDSFLCMYKKNFVNNPVFGEVLIGGFNLSKIVNKMTVIENPYARFNFSSLIGLMRNNCFQMKSLRHKNAYREYMIHREAEGKLLYVLKKLKPDYVFMDFLEERFDILAYDNGYMTYSDALKDVNENLLGEFKVIKRDAKECLELWKECFDEFYLFVKDNLVGTQIVIVENYLCEKYGDGKERYEYKDIMKIRKDNQNIKKYYDYVRTSYPKIRLINTGNINDYVTDINYEFGCHPENFNEWCNIKIARNIEESIGLQFF